MQARNQIKIDFKKSAVFLMQHTLGPFKSYWPASQKLIQILWEFSGIIWAKDEGGGYEPELIHHNRQGRWRAAAGGDRASIHPLWPL